MGFFASIPTVYSLKSNGWSLGKQEGMNILKERLVVLTVIDGLIWISCKPDEKGNHII